MKRLIYLSYIFGQYKIIQQQKAKTKKTQTRRSVFQQGSIDSSS